MEGVAVTAVRWIPRGFAKEEPSSLMMAEDEVKELLDEMKEMGVRVGDIDEKDEENDEEKDEEGRQFDDLQPEFDMDHYDSDDDDDGIEKLAKGDFPGRQFFSTLDSDLPNALNDPYLQDLEEDSEDEDERDAHQIRPTDCPLIACSTDQELPTLEVYLYEHETGAFFIHHDINVGAPPLCVEWLDRISTSYASNGGGSFAAVGSYGHGMIEIWDLDVMDVMEPVLTLGQLPQFGKKKKRKNLQIRKGIEGHTAPVLSLHKNPHNTAVLASASADESVRIWDLMVPSCVETLTHHTDKVQTLKWHPIEEPILLTAAYDKTLAVVDARTSSRVLKGLLHADAESCSWDRHSPTNCWVSAEDGVVSVFDLRTISDDVTRSDPLYRMEAHTAACTGISDCSVPGMMVTCSLSGDARVWNSKDLTLGSPSMVFERQLKAGPLFAVNSNPDESTVFSFGGNVVVVWDVGDTNAINLAFGMPLVESSDAPAPRRIPVITSKAEKSKNKK